MIKNIYDRQNKYYKHEYYCDNCFKVLNYSEIFRQEFAIQAEKFDLCFDCVIEWDKKEEKWNNTK